MKQIITFIAIIACTSQLHAQTQFVNSGKIEFERRTNTHRLFFTNDDGSPSEDEFKKLIPQFRTEYFDLLFNEEKSLYKPGKEVEAPKLDWFTTPGNENTVYKDLRSMTSVSNKSAFESRFLLFDSLKTATWRLQPETRTIAGFECRKAITTICDSVVVVAFYTDQIVAPSGPESFSGLPGMILGLAVPRLYTTWFATKLENITPAQEAQIAPPSKGKKATTADMSSAINAGIKNWGAKYRDRSLWFVAL